jgi:hypothetical protein
MDDSLWRDPTWLAGAVGWIDERLAERGLTRVADVEQPHVYPWSTVLRVPVEAGTLWFKANAESLRHEAALVEIVAGRRPDVVPPLLACDTPRGWMLMADAGEMLRTVVPRERSLDRWRDVLRLYAGVQIDLTDDVEKLLEIGIPDMRLAALPGRYVELLDVVDAEPRFRDAGPRVAELCEELASYGVPETLQHDDLHDGQVSVKDGRYLLMDWGDACVSHPFLTLSVTLEGVIAWGLDDVASSVETAPFRDAYLAPFAERYAGELTRAVDVALRLGWVCRAVNGHVPGQDEQTLTRLRMFLDGRP